jgi:hypothetical protein
MKGILKYRKSFRLLVLTISSLSKVVKPKPVIVVQPIQQIGESAAKSDHKKAKRGIREISHTMLRLKTEILQGQTIMDLR